jgi:hypothetical protein
LRYCLHSYDHSFRYAQAQNGMKPVRMSAISVKISARMQAHYRTRGGEWAQRFADRIFMCADRSFKHK